MSDTIPRPDLKPGQQVRFSYPRMDRRLWWTVRAADERFVILTRQAEFHPKGVLRYTIIDWVRGLRGPCNEIGNGWGDGTFSDAECDALLRALNAVDGNSSVGMAVEVSYRNNVPIEIAAIGGGGDES